MEDVQALFGQWGQQLMEWAQSPAFLAQLGAVVVAIILSPILARIVRKKVFLFRDEPDQSTKLFAVRKFIFRTGSFLRALILVLLLAGFAAALKAVPALGQDGLVKLAQSLALIFLIYRVIKEFISDPLFRKLAIWTLIPLGLIIALGYGDDLSGVLNLSLIHI